ncbi:HlyD family secretion protein [Stieleria varia]|uniref:Macrolide export protein MacA n=1 Tax=Stieleria varia TaxID=2528005 RepID=A0A5C6A034_9BACT|nr:HlyD family efflux transporter periplasmic adaptor subunit [Stieleria varia]TWT93182.1 Macrolide export protein MacA [Stieleria varia]
MVGGSHDNATRLPHFTQHALWLCFVALICDWIPVASAETIVIDGLVAKLSFEIDVPASEAGPLIEMNVRKGDTVALGEIVARVDDRHAVLQSELAGVAHEVARHHLAAFSDDKLAEKKLEATELLQQQQRLLAQMAQDKAANETQISSAEKSAALAKNELQRALKARETFVDSVSESELENLRLKVEHAELVRQQAVADQKSNSLAADSEDAAVQLATVEIENARLKLADAVSSKSLLRLNLQAKEKELALSKLAVERFKIVAPADATVVEVYRMNGEWVQPGEKVIRVVGLSQLHAEGFLAAGQSTKLRRGQKVQLTLSSEPSTQVVGVVDFVSPQVDRINDEVRFLVRFENPGERILPGMKLSLSVDDR